MSTNPAPDGRVAPSASTASAVAALLVYECERDSPLVSIPRPEVHLVVRFGPAARGDVDVHAFGARDTAHRKVIRTGQRTVTVRLQLGANEAVLGVTAASLAGRIVALDELWGAAAAGRLLDRLADSRSTLEAAAIVDAAIGERLASAARRTPAPISLAAADRLTRASVNDVAVDLGVSARHLRRVFREAVGVNPKTYAKLTRFHHALRVARTGGRPNWASVAAQAGYYDQAHLIAEFRAITGVTPGTLLRELHAAAVT